MTKPLFKNYGLNWRRSEVIWGSQGKGNTGSLKGARRGNRRQVVDFRDQIAIYVLYDESRHPIYVGQSGRGKQKRLFSRLKDHTNSDLAHRWYYFSWFGFRKVNNDGKLAKATKTVSATISQALDQIEGILMAAAAPAFNKQGARFKGIPHFKQAAGEEITLSTIMSTLRELSEIVKRGNQRK